MKGYIVLENGEKFEGDLYGDASEVYGEVVFYTGMTGYEQVLTDPASQGQIIVFTYPLIGNCGISEEGASSKLHASGLIMSQVSEKGFHYECEMSLSEYSCGQSVPLLANVDTRAIVKRIRELGDMKAVLTTDPANVHFDRQPAANLQAASELIKQATTFGQGKDHIVIIDYGHQKSLVKPLLQQGYKVTVVPNTASVKDIEKLQPNGVIYTNGPGDPSLFAEELKTIKKVAMSYPSFGIGLGHQLLALAFGAKTEKLKCGHRGLSHPVIDQQTNKVYMTAQNHSYMVVEQSLNLTNFKPKFKNVNDQTIEGLVHETYPIMTTQFDPIGHPGPSDSESLFFSNIEMLFCKGREKVYA